MQPSYEAFLNIVETDSVAATAIEMEMMNF